MKAKIIIIVPKNKNTAYKFHVAMIPINGFIIACKIPPSILIALKNIALFSDSICLLIPSVKINRRENPNPIMIIIKIILIGTNVVKLMNISLIQ